MCKSFFWESTSCQSRVLTFLKREEEEEKSTKSSAFIIFLRKETFQAAPTARCVLLLPLFSIRCQLGRNSKSRRRIRGGLKAIYGPETAK